MTSTLRGTVAALACVLAAGTVTLPAQTAQAQTLMDLFFKNRSSAPQQQPDFRAQEEEFGRIEQEAQAAQQRQQAPRPVVATAKYHVYKADTLRLVAFDKLIDPVVTGSVEPTGAPRAAAGDFSAAALHLADLRLRALPEVADAVEAHYGDKPAFIWVSDGRPNQRARHVLAVLKGADSVGLSAEDYGVAMPARGGDAEARARDLIRFEMALSVKALTYALDAMRGRVDPNRISGYHDFERKTVNLDSAMTILASFDDAGGYLEARSPNHAQFTALIAELKRLKSADEVERVTIAEGTFLKPGGQSDEVANIVAAIRLKASDAIKTDHALTFAEYKGEPGYTGAVVELVKAFQAENGLTADGIVGRNTIRAMVGMSNADKINKVMLAMERARWLNRDLGERNIFINQPAYRVTYTENGREKLSMRVVVGTKQNQTNFFQDEVEIVEFNPYWGVPRSIIVNEMLPKLRADPSYLDRLGYEVTDASGRHLSSSSINWYGVGANVPYNVRQPPGDANALGELKILFPNSHAIYMHDTPQRDLFKRDDRAFSHGCVRLQDPRAMAAAVLGTTVEDVAAQIAQGENKAVDVPEKLPVYIAYFTAWPTQDGTVEYFDDVYERDMYLGRAIDATNTVRQAQI